MQTERLHRLLRAYHDAPEEFQATRYWRNYEKDILDVLSSLKPDELRSGDHPMLATFGFGDVVYYEGKSPPPVWKRLMFKVVRALSARHGAARPYKVSKADIRQMAYHHCELMGRLCGAEPVSNLSMSTFGNPADCFEVDGRTYSVHFLRYYLRYCFAYRHVGFGGGGGARW